MSRLPCCSLMASLPVCSCWQAPRCTARWRDGSIRRCLCTGFFRKPRSTFCRILSANAASSVSVETLALEYLALIRSAQPHGPYYLGGFSIGGALAFEVARRLKQAGEEIGLILLLDSMLPGRGFKHLQAGLRRRLRMLRRQGLSHLLHIYRVYRTQTARRHEPGIKRNQAYAQAMRAHEAAPCDLPTVFFQASDDASTAPAYGWTALVPGLTVERVPGQHMDILEPPNVDVLASLVRRHIAATKNASGRTDSTGIASLPDNSSASITCS